MNGHDEVIGMCILCGLPLKKSEAISAYTETPSFFDSVSSRTPVVNARGITIYSFSFKHKACLQNKSLKTSW